MIYKDLEEKYGSGVYYKRDLEIVRGKEFIFTIAKIMNI